MGDLPCIVRDMLQCNYVLMKCQLACSDCRTGNWITVMMFIRLLIFRDQLLHVLMSFLGIRPCGALYIKLDSLFSV